MSTANRTLCKAIRGVVRAVAVRAVWTFIWGCVKWPFTRRQATQPGVTAPRRPAAKLSTQEKIFFAVCLIFTLLLLGAFEIKTELRTSVHWQYWTQVLTGNWSPQQPQETLTLLGQQKEPFISDVEYTAGVIGALVINLGPYALIFGALWSLVKWRNNMKLVSIFASREVTIEGNVIRAMLDLLPEDQQKHAVEEMQRAIKDARDDWWGPLLNERFGPEEAEKLRKKMLEMNINP
jgi:hypothetical protein